MPSRLNDRTARGIPREPLAPRSCDRSAARGGGEAEGNCVLGDGHGQRRDIHSCHDPQVVTYPRGYERHRAGSEHIRQDRSVVASCQDHSGRTREHHTCDETTHSEA
jgi:hypothetical protein